MSRLFLASLALVAFSALPSMAGTGFTGAKAGPAVYNINDQVGENGLTFDSDAPMEKIHGTAHGITGTFRLDPSNIDATAGEMIVEVRSMKTAISKRDDHMYGSKWLDADAFPTISFRFKGLRDVKATTQDGRNVATANAVGTFTCHGVTKPLTAKVTITFVPESKETAKRAPGNLVMVTATFSVALKDHNITGSGDIVGTKVGEVIKVEAQLFANSGNSAAK